MAYTAVYYSIYNGPDYFFKNFGIAHVCEAPIEHLAPLFLFFRVLLSLPDGTDVELEEWHNHRQCNHQRESVLHGFWSPFRVKSQLYHIFPGPWAVF